MYEDKDSLRKEEIAALSGPNEFQEFYARLKQIKEFHRKHPNEVSFNFFNFMLRISDNCKQICLYFILLNHI